MAAAIMPHRADLPGASLIADGGLGQIKKSGTATVASLSSLPRRGRSGRLFGALASAAASSHDTFHFSPTEYPRNVETGSGSPGRLTESRGNGATRRCSSSLLARERPHGTRAFPSPEEGRQVHADALPPLPGTQRSPAAAKRVRTNHRTKKSGTATGEHGLPSLSDMKETGGLF